MRDWLTQVLENSSLTGEAEGYLYSRGALEDTINKMGFVVWSPPDEEAPHPDFQDRYGKRGEKLAGLLAYGLYSPAGDLIGVEARGIDRKWVTRFLLPAAAWNPVWVGVNIMMERIWSGAPVWLVEGVFDLLALQQVVNDAILGSLRGRVTKKQCDFLERFAKEVRIMYDLDSTGREGTEHALENLRRREILCSSIRYSGGKDPCEVWEKTGTEGLREQLAHVI